jgi:DNA-binding MarR family transcriptional regulator
MSGWGASVYAGPQRSPGFRFWHRFMDWQRGLNAVLRPLGLTQPQFALLAVCGWLAREGDTVTQAGVVAETGMDKMHVSQIVSRLEREGLVARGTDARDQRAKALRLTPEGWTRLNAALPLVERYDTAFFSGDSGAGA